MSRPKLNLWDTQSHLVRTGKLLSGIEKKKLNPPRVVHLLTTNEPTVTHHHPKSRAYVTTHSWYCSFYGFGQIYNGMLSTTIQIVSSTYSSSLLLNPWPLLIFSLSPVLTFPKCPIIKNQKPFQVDFFTLMCIKGFFTSFGRHRGGTARQRGG